MEVCAAQGGCQGTCHQNVFDCVWGGGRGGLVRVVRVVVASGRWVVHVLPWVQVLRNDQTLSADR
jgi:hypothetical protein